MTLPRKVDGDGVTRDGVQLPRLTIRRLAAVCAILAAIALAGCGEAGLSESSTCKDFLAADPADQQSVTQQLAGKFNKPDYASPLGMPEVPYYCAGNPDTTLKEFFESAG
jgi:hypothetical protein